MRMQKVNVPPHFAVVCAGCGKRGQTNQPGFAPVWADLDGEPFKAYYCNPCKLRQSSNRSETP